MLLSGSGPIVNSGDSEEFQVCHGFSVDLQEDARRDKEVGDEVGASPQLGFGSAVPFDRRALDVDHRKEERRAGWDCTIPIRLAKDHPRLKLDRGERPAQEPDLPRLAFAAVRGFEEWVLIDRQREQPLPL